jgi:hypothetical protein
MNVHFSLLSVSMETVNWCLLHLPLWRRRTMVVGIDFFVLFGKWLSDQAVKFVSFQTSMMES